MDSQDQSTQPLQQIICDKIIFQRLQSLQENEQVRLSLLPLKLQKERKQLKFIVLDMAKSKLNENSKIIQFTKQDFVRVSSAIVNGSHNNQILTYSFTNQAIGELMSQQSKQSIKILTLDVKEINQILKSCAIVRLKLPNGFYLKQDIVYSLEGYKYNQVGQIRENWGFINNGRVTKDVFLRDNEKQREQIKKNVFYSKSQLKYIIELINKVNSLSFQQQHNDDKSFSKLAQNLSLLGENFIHSQKLITTANILLPVISYEIQLICSEGRGESCRNKISNENLQPVRQDGTLELVCLNFANGLQTCVKQVQSKIQTLFKNEEKNVKINDQSHISLSSNSLYMTTMPLKLVNPHIFLKTQAKQKFLQYYAKGLYEYYHYGDHNFNDQGWGCAYRSLQTLLSWFRLQQKLNLHSVPTIPEIQNIIDLIDCTSQQKLSNSKTWIGATQVSWVVKKLTGYDSRILHIKDGKDIIQHAQMFREHLQNVGTPIMYGGDEYAYSIVGINYSWKLGQVMFCILDPHYNGSDKIQKIIQKKGISWRRPEEMFKKGVFYNFCLPIL